MKIKWCSPFFPDFHRLSKTIYHGKPPFISDGWYSWSWKRILRKWWWRRRQWRQRWRRRWQGMIITNKKTTNLQFPSSRITRLMDHPWPSSSTYHKSVVGSCHRKQRTKKGVIHGTHWTKPTFDHYSGLLAGACLVQTSDIVAIYGEMKRGPRHPSPQVCFLACNKEPLLNPHWVSDHSGCKPSCVLKLEKKTGYLVGTWYMVYVFGYIWIYHISISHVPWGCLKDT